MMNALIRKARQVAADPVLRRWLAARILRLTPGEPPFQAHRPPYLADTTLTPPDDLELPWPELPLAAPTKAIDLPLPGCHVRLMPGDEHGFIRQSFDDTETLLGLHRFAWLPLLGAQADPAWVGTLWRAWAEAFATPDDGWAWHPYTAAERAINILAYARLTGLPGPREATVALLAAHGPAIARRLEYFGDHHTGNHMANNGRGLFLLGLALGWRECADMGGRILVEEGARIFLPSGLLREGSSHYHLLLTRGYVSAWLAARAHGRPEASALEEIARRALAVLPHLALPGGMPLVGDVSPDCPPSFLAGLLTGGTGGWLDLLSSDESAALAALRGEAVAADTLTADGFLRADFGAWQGLWHAAPTGWAHMPGHGHQDLGAAELHWRGIPLFVDPGRGAYGDDGDAALYRSAAAHGLLQIDDDDPYPPNRPYYHDRFRARVGGPPPHLERHGQEVRLRHHGYGRLGATCVERVWRFTETGLTIDDTVSGRGRHGLTRRLVTPWPARVEAAGTVAVTLPDAIVRLSADAALTVRPTTRWTAYGEGQPAWSVESRSDARLPWRGRLAVEVC